MSKIIQVSSRLWRIEIGIVNVYLMKTRDGLVLVDSAWPNKADEILEGVRRTGHDPAEIRHVLLTHGHVERAVGHQNVETHVPKLLRDLL
jgi:glyoxylase-like metal-dependent hydrolase (beta-lactamase superfamily II)